MKSAWSILLSLLVVLSGTMPAMAATPGCVTESVSPTKCCCGDGCGCYASSKSDHDPLPAVPPAQQGTETRFISLAIAWDLPACPATTLHLPSLLVTQRQVPEHVPLFQRHCSLLR
jgi:hypothetical protein